MRTEEQLKMIDIWDDVVATFTPEEEDLFIRVSNERARRMSENVKPPCPCSFCDNWVDSDELYYTIGYQHDKLICIQCAEPIFVGEDKEDD